MKHLRLQDFENSSILLRFHIFFVLLAIIPLGVLMFLYSLIEENGGVDLSADQLNTTLLIVTFGIIAGYFSMRFMLKGLIDITMLTSEKLEKILGSKQMNSLLKGNENEIAVLTRTFGEITSRLEENVQTLEVTKRTMQSVLTRVGRGISNLRNLDTFFDLIVETTTEALFGKKGFLLLLDNERQVLLLKTVYGMSSKMFSKDGIPVDSSLFSQVLQARNALILPKTNFSSLISERDDGLEYPLICAPLVLRDKVLGIIAVSGRKHGASFHSEEMDLLMNLATQTAVAIENSNLNSNIDKAYFEILAALAMAVEAKDPYSRGHLDRVANISVLTGQALGMELQQIGFLRDAAKLHDVGKIGVTDEILAKPSPLNDQEWMIMKRHPEIGEGIVSQVSSLQPLRDIIRHHHEKLDGSGYPDRLKGDLLSLSVRILGIADIYDALTTDRPYRNAMSRQEAIDVMRFMGDKIDQKVVDVVISVTS